MNRRALLKFLGMLPFLKFAPALAPKPSAYQTYIVGKDAAFAIPTCVAVIGEYKDYCNFSLLSVETALDQTVENTARELSYRAGFSFDTLAAGAAS